MVILGGVSLTFHRCAQSMYRRVLRSMMYIVFLYICTISSVQFTSAKIHDKKDYTSSVVYVESISLTGHINKGSAVVVQKINNDDQTTYTLLTAYHVIANAHTINVYITDRTTFPAPNTSSSFTARLLNTPLDVKKCEGIFNNLKECTHDIALFDITTTDDALLLHPLPLALSPPRKNESVTLAGFTGGQYVQSNAKIIEVLNLKKLDKNIPNQGESIVTNKQIKAGHSGGAVIYNEKLVGIAIKSTVFDARRQKTKQPKTYSVSVLQYCSFWGTTRLSQACRGTLAGKALRTPQYVALKRKPPRSL
jgi:hypothetical protein